MRTKLLVGAAILAAGLASSQAQNVYSANVVGYYNVTVPAAKFAMVANQLVGTNGDNSANDALQTGVVSSSTQLLLWNGHGYNSFTYYNIADAAPYPAGWYDLGGNICTNDLFQGTGGFLYNAAAAPITVTVVGQVVQGSVSVPVGAGFNIYSIVPPIATNIDATVVGFPAHGDGSDTYLHWNGAGFDASLNYYDAANAAPYPAGWYDLGGTLQSTNSAFWPKVGEAFFVNRSGTGTTWTSSFTVQ